MNIAVSACLIGIDCKYNGESNKNDDVIALAKEHTLIPVCPEQLGGLPTPRIPSEIVNDRVITKDGRDVSDNYKKGAVSALCISKLSGCQAAVLKEGSPSCGSNFIYDGSFSGVKIPGTGICARLFEEEGIKVYSEKNLDI